MAPSFKISLFIACIGLTLAAADVSAATPNHHNRGSFQDGRYIPIFHGNIEWFNPANQWGKPLVDCFFDADCIGPVRPDIITLSECPAQLSKPFMDYLNSKSAVKYKLWATPSVNNKYGGKCVIFNDRFSATKTRDWVQWKRWQTPHHAWSSSCVRGNSDTQHYRVRLFDRWANKYVRIVGIHPEAIAAQDECGHKNGDEECARRNVQEAITQALNAPADPLKIVVGDWNYVNRCRPTSWYFTQCTTDSPGCIEGGVRVGYPPAYQLMTTNYFRDVYGDDPVGRNTDNAVGSDLNIDHIHARASGRAWPWHAANNGAGVRSSTSRMIRKDFYGLQNSFSDHWRHWFGLAYY